MRTPFVIVGLFVAALSAACGSPSVGKSGKSDGAIAGDGAAGAVVDASYVPDSANEVGRTGNEAGPVDANSTGGAAGTGGTTGGTTATGTGGVGGSDAPAATGGVVGSDGPTATGGASTTDAPVATGGVVGSDGLAATGGASIADAPLATGGVDSRDVPVTTGGSGSGGTGGTTAGTTGSGGTTGTAGTTATGGTTATAGASGTTPLADNATEVYVDFGLPGIGYLNGLFATVTVCVPGTSQCQSIDHVLVDTGSEGLRLLGSVLRLSLPAWTNSSGVALAECGQFVGGFMWGPLRSADVRIAGERAAALFAHANNVAFSNLGAPSFAPRSGTTTIGAYFDWGLPFYFGRKVFTAIEARSTPAGTGPFVAF